MHERTMVLCFDGTGNKFGENISNVVRFFRALEKNDGQIVYYQPGVGTYDTQSFMLSMMDSFWSLTDFAIAWDLDKHVKEGYRFVVENYRIGDRICLFGFSRGAYTARVLAGMIYKVGILRKLNISHIDFAFSIYRTTGYEGYLLSREFRQTFANHHEGMPVTVDFLGCWDTVGSVGLIPFTLPYTSVNYGVKVFRHALALDECRVRFRPSLWCEQTPEREEDLDLDIPRHTPIESVDRDSWRYEPPKRDHTDSKEVWFAGCHADVGGGSHSKQRTYSLSFISLRWMIKECFLTNAPILFDLDYLRSLDFDSVDTFNELDRKGITREDIARHFSLKHQWRAAKRDNKLIQIRNEITIKIKEEMTKVSKHPLEKLKILRRVIDLRKRLSLYNSFDEDDDEEYGEEKVLERLAEERPMGQMEDICDRIFDQMLFSISWGMWIIWWILEYTPILYSKQDEHGNWVRFRSFNLGRGRFIPFHNNKIYVHKSVRERIKNMANTPEPYVPRARNWNHITQNPYMVEYVD